MKCRHLQEIDEMEKIYQRRFPGWIGTYLVGSSLCNNNHRYGDSGRFHELMSLHTRQCILKKFTIFEKIINYINPKDKK